VDLFSISQLSGFSGIKPHTIRIWEQRYGALQPNRSEGNTRYYDSSQLRRLLNIVSLMNTDYKVSELCTMPDKKLFKLINELLQTGVSKDEVIEYFISQLIAAGMSYDEPHFEKIFSHSLLRYGIKDNYIKIIYPMLVRIGLMWAGDTIPPAQEHFISHIIRQKLFTSIDALPPPDSSAGSWLLFLPENESHDIGLLVANYIIRASGKKVIYLGSNVPFESLIAAVADTSPQNLLLFLVHHDSPQKMEAYLTKLNKTFSNRKIYVAGQSAISRLKTEKKINLLRSVEDLEQIVSV
jgi:mannitol/fructose-specific phosphotransferase system IIA component (Ntr-type)